jgi:hypothetical protein
MHVVQLAHTDLWPLPTVLDPPCAWPHDSEVPNER